jgi:CRP-like cAMP-binding protein
MPHPFPPGRGASAPVVFGHNDSKHDRRTTAHPASMEDLDFTAPEPARPAPAPASSAPAAPFKAAQSPYYKADVARAIFESAGRAESFAAGEAIFGEDEKAVGGLFSRKSAARMYFLAEGEVALTVGAKPLDTIRAGEIFGEMAVLSDQPRSAAARARTDCRAWSLGAEELRVALKRVPEFALMLMSVMFDRLRFVAARLAMRKGARAVGGRVAARLEPAVLARVEAGLGRTALARHARGTTLMREGQAGTCLYVVKEGSVLIHIGQAVLERVPAGGTFGEMAVVDQSPRTASATAETDCELLAIDRASFIDAVKREPAFATTMLRDIAERLRHMNAQVG